jgi:integrase
MGIGTVFYKKKESKDRQGNPRGCWRYEDKQLKITDTLNESYCRQIQRLREAGIFNPIKELVDMLIKQKDSPELQRSTTVSECIGDYIDLKMKAYTTKTDQPPPEYKIKKNEVSRRNHLKNFLKMFGSKGINEVTPEDIQTFHYERRTQVSVRGKPVSIGTVRTELKQIKSLYNHASRLWKFDGRNPVNQSGIRLKETNRTRVATDKEMKSLFDNADKDMRDLFVLYSYTGCRKDEILSLEWKWVDLNANKIHLPAHICKGGKERDAVINTESHTILNNRQMIRRISKFVFPSTKSKSGHLTYPDYSWKKLLKKCGIENLTLHDLRRTCGTRLAELGVHPEAIQKYLGHADYRTTQGYIHVSDKMTEEAGNLLSFTDSREKSDEQTV